MVIIDSADSIYLSSSHSSQSYSIYTFSKTGEKMILVSLVLSSCLCWLSLSRLAAQSTLPEERAVLCDLYNETNGPHWDWSLVNSSQQISDSTYSYYFTNTNDIPWNCSVSSNASDPCKDGWFGVACSCKNYQCSIKFLELPNMNITGSYLPVFDLKNLLSLDLADNFLSGSLPRLTSTQLQSLRVRNNRFRGNISDAYSSLRSLELFRIGFNKITGSIPSFFGAFSNLTRIGVFGNSLTGTLPAALFRLTKLKYLRVHENNFHGRLPSSISSLSNIQFIELYRNRFSGQLPSDLSKLRKLLVFTINENRFSGALPEFEGMDSLLDLYLHHNRFTGNLPNSLGKLARLERLALSANDFRGNLISVFKSPLRSLLTIDLSDNHFEDGLPSALFNSSKLEYFAASLNCITNQLPDTMCSATSLKYLALAGLAAAEE